ncbi:MAG: aminotransferase class III-fold pyridoxal phosphate-dependent enzyme, partial [Bacteroidota bacterium]
LMCAFDLPTAELRNAVRKRAYDLGLIILGCGANTLRFRPALTVTEADIDAGLAILEQAIKETV